MPTTILIATRNAHKTQEIQAMLGDSFTVTDLSISSLPPVEETGTTFLENATLKAVEISKLIPSLILSDDSGLEVDALNGEPGVYSSRYGGEDGNDSLNNATLLKNLEKSSATPPLTARFRCVMVLAQAGKSLAHFSGAIEGSITTDAAGAEGFGYDPLFIPEGHSKTFAQLPISTKNELSHRAHALTQVIQWLSAQR